MFILREKIVRRRNEIVLFFSQHDNDRTRYYLTYTGYHVFRFSLRNTRLFRALHVRPSVYTRIMFYTVYAWPPSGMELHGIDDRRSKAERDDV